MARIASSLKPQESEKPQKKLEYNDKTYQSYIDNGFEEHIPEKVQRVHDFHEDFLNRVDLTKGPIRFRVNSFVRLKAIDYNSKNLARKEFLTYSVDWIAKDWKGDDIRQRQVMEHIEGVFLEQLKEKVTEKGQLVGYERSGERTVYYIPWDKDHKLIDKLIEESVGTDKETITFTVKFLSNRTAFTYEQFVNLSYQELSDLQTKSKDPRTVPLGTKL